MFGVNRNGSRFDKRARCVVVVVSTVDCAGCGEVMVGRNVGKRAYLSHLEGKFQKRSDGRQETGLRKRETGTKPIWPKWETENGHLWR